MRKLFCQIFQDVEMHSGCFSRRIKKGMEEEEAPGCHKPGLLLSSASPTGRVPRKQAGKHKKLLRAQAESQNFGWERSPRSLNPTFYPVLPRPKHVRRCHIQGQPLLNPCRDGTPPLPDHPGQGALPLPQQGDSSAVTHLTLKLHPNQHHKMCKSHSTATKSINIPGQGYLPSAQSRRWFTLLPSHRDCLWKEEAQLQRKALIQ